MQLMTLVNVQVYNIDVLVLILSHATYRDVLNYTFVTFLYTSKKSKRIIFFLLNI